MIAEVIIMREEETKRTSPKSNVQKFFRKRWVFPAIYLVSAAIILSAVLWFQGNNDVADSDKYNYNESDLLDTSKNEDDSIVVNRPAENFAMPVLNEDTIEIARQFYNVDGTSEEQEAALVFYDNTYYENKGIDIVAKDGNTFDVTASLAGTVVKSEKDSLFGHVVEIEHAEGVVTVYQALSDVQVKQGDRVDQGQVIAKAGKNVFNESAGIHVHFEIRNSGVAVNPIEYFGKPLTSLGEEDNASEEQPAEEEKAPADEEKTPADEEKTPADEEEAEGEEAPEEDENKEDSTESSEATIGMAKA